MNMNTVAPSTLWYDHVLEPLCPRNQELLNTLVREIGRQRPSIKRVTRDLVLRDKHAAAWFLEGLYQAHFSLPKAALVVPQAKRFYASSYKRPFPFPYATMMRVIAAAGALGWIETHIGHNLGEGAKMTTVRASSSLASLFDRMGYEWLPLANPPDDKLLIVTDGSKQKRRRPVTPSDGPQVPNWLSNLHTINECFLAHSIYLDAPNEIIQNLADRVARVDTGNAPVVSFSQVTLRRIFTRDRIDLGGRFYGGWWQLIPSEMRKHIGIDGHLTVEADFSGMALNCLYALENALPVQEDTQVSVLG